MQNKKRTFKEYSISKKLREEKKSNEYFEMLLSSISLEDLIALRLEVSYRNTGVLLYNLPIWKSLDFLIKDAALKYAVSVNDSKLKASQFLGMNIKEFNIYYKRYNLEKFFNEGEKNEC